MEKKIIRLLSFVLCLSIVIGLLPMGAMATEDTSAEPKQATRAASTASYLDIPVEVYDFRADGFLFESTSTFGAPYSLSSDSPVMTLPDGTEVERPGEYKLGDNGTERYAFYIEGLIEDALYYDKARDQKRVVYKPETIEYIAAALSGSRYRPNTSYYDTHWNDVFQQMVPDINTDERLTLGSWDETLGKIEGGVNGGVLLYSQVETCYDLAYYMLSNVWGPVPSDDVLRQEETNTGLKDMYYNMLLPELKKLRLKNDGNGNYSFKSSSPSTYDATEGYIYNGGTAESGLPAFNIVNNLGFEHPDYFGNDTTGYKEELLTSGPYKENRNYYYTLHAHSAFVYYEEADLYFEFVGDDDVYFFINDTLKCDIGGIHGSPRRRIELNNIADELGLKEGDICTFDMFFADRHLTSINLHFTTNIIMMDESVITTKEQYNTSTGQDIKNGTAVLAGSSVGYGFSMLNRREFGVTNLTFTDTSLGVTLSPSTIALNKKATTANLKLVYQTYDAANGVLHETPKSNVTYDSFYSILSAAINSPTTTINPLAIGVYTLTGLTDAQLKNLLALGIPAHTKLSISGLTNTAALGEYTNTVETSCTPKDISGALGNPINGSASRSIHGAAFEGLSVMEPKQIVVDYGKPVEFSPDDLLRNINYDVSTYTLDFIGLKANDQNGSIYVSEPKNLTCTEEGASFSTQNGTFTHCGDKIRFQMTDFFDEIETRYLVYSVAASGTIVYYLVLELQLIPANQMYYETDFADGVFQTEAVDSHLFFDFTDTEPDQARYNSRLYSYTNYDNGNWSNNSFRNTPPVFDNDAGTMSVGCKDLNADSLVGTDYYNSTQYYVQLGEKFTNGDFLNYNPANTEIIIVRMKLNGLKSVSTPMRMTFHYGTDDANSVWASGVDVPESAITSGEYFTLVFDSFASAYLNAAHINTVRFTISGVTLTDPTVMGEMVFDYIYIGPKSEAPERTKQNLFFDFSNDAAATERYAHDVYGGYSFDESCWAPSYAMNSTDGTMSVDVANNASATDTNGPYIGVTNLDKQFPWYNNPERAPLTYTPSKAEYLQVRFKTTGLKTVSTSNPSFGIFFHYIKNSTNGSAYTPYYTFTLNNDTYTVLTFDLSSTTFCTADTIKSIGFKFRNLNGDGATGQIIFDYIYIGAKDGLPISSDSVYFDFTNTRADQSRYNTHTYGKLNYDTGNWTYAGDRMTKPVFDNVIGTISSMIDKHSNTTSTGFYLQCSPGLQTNFKMHYIPKNATKIQVRFKMENVLTANASALPTVRFVAFKYESDTGSASYANATDPLTFPTAYLSNGEYLTMTFDTKEAFRAFTEMTALRIVFDNLTIASTASPGKITLDYLFVGSSEDLAQFHASRGDRDWKDIGTAQNETQDLSYADEAITQIEKPSGDYLLFSYDDNDATAYRYDTAVYGGNANGVYTDDTDFDLATNWYNNDDRTVDPSVAAGAMHSDLALTISGYHYWIETKVRKLNYTPKATDYLYMRIKFENVEPTTDSGLGKLQIWYYVDDTTKLYGGNETSFNISSSTGYVTLRIALTNAGYTSTGTMNGFRFGLYDFKEVDGQDGSFDIDYIFIGSDEDAKKVLGTELYIGLTNSASDQARYRENLAYNDSNRDISGAWSANTTNFTAPSFDYNEGTVSFTMTSTGYESSANPYIQISTAIRSGLSLQYNPEDAEIIQIRFKLENYVAKGTSKPNFTAYHFIYPQYKEFTYTNSDGTTYKREIIDECGMNDASVLYDFEQACKDYVVVNLPVNDKFKAARIEREGQTADEEYITSIRLQWSNLLSASESQLGKIIIDYVYVGTEEGAPVQTTYGYDTSYDDDVKLSNGSALVVQGLGVPTMKVDETSKATLINYDAAKQYTEAAFSFKGTGFDIISRTGVDQGAIRAVITDSAGKYVKTVSVVNKSEGNLEFYQTPVISVQGLAYNTYKVHLFVNAPYDYGNDGTADSFNGSLDRGGEFCFDAVRIYDPLGSNGQSYYTTHAEVNPTITEIRSMLIDANSYSAGGSMSGAVFLDKTASGATIADYKAIGPNNETYLSAGQAIAFKLVADSTIPTSVDIGAKAINALSANLTISVTSSAPSAIPSKQARSIISSAAQYYPITIPLSTWKTASDGSKYVYVTIHNADGAGVLSLTDIKYAYSTVSAPSKSMRFVIDSDLLASVEHDSVLDENLTFTTSISAGAEMTVSYSIRAGAVNSYADFYLEVTKDVAGGEPVTTIYDSEVMTVKSDPTSGEALMYQVTYTGINAKEMGDNFSTTLYAVGEDGTIYYGNTVVDSIKSFLIGKIDADASSTELRTMAVDMLKYGAAAQVRLGYNTENLVTADLTEEQLAYATQEIPEAVDYASATGSGANVNTNISVSSRVQLNLSCIYSEVTDPRTVKCVITDAEGNVLAELTTTNKSGVMFSAIYENVGAKEMRDVINATFYEGETVISKTVSWSVESYVAQVRAKSNATADEINMVNAMLTYGDAVAAYMTATGQ